MFICDLVSPNLVGPARYLVGQARIWWGRMLSYTEAKAGSVHGDRSSWVGGQMSMAGLLLSRRHREGLRISYTYAEPAIGATTLQ